MTRGQALAVLKANEAELRRQGVAHAALFGSLARGDSNAMSDVDVFVRFAPDASITLWDYAGLKRRVARMLGASRLKVDVIDLDGMSSHVRSSAERDAVYAF
jgi:predicted nucleotidyltransferase